MRSLKGWRRRLATPVVKNAMYLIASEAVAAVLGLFFWAVAARSFADPDVGVAAVLISSVTLLAILSTLGFNVSLVRFLPERTSHAVRLVNSSVTIGSAVAVALSIAFAAAAGRWSPALSFLAENPAVAALFVFFTVIWTISLLFDAAFIGLGRSDFVLVRSVIYNGLKVPLPFALGALFATAPAFALLSAWGVGLLVANLVAAGAMFVSIIPAFRLRPEVDRASVAGMVRYSFANHATNVLGALPGLALPLLIIRTLPPENAAYFYVAWVLANFLFIVPGSIFTSVFAEGSRWVPGLRANARDGLFLSLAILAPGVVVALAAGPAVLAFFKPSFALAASALLNVLAVSSFFVAFNVLYITVLRVDRRMRPVVGIYAATTFGALALAIPLMSLTGLVGAGLGFAITQGAGALYSVRAMLREGVLPG